MQKATGDDIGSLDEELYFSTPRNNGTASPASTTPQCDPHANHTWDPSKKILFSTRTSLLGRDNTWNAHRGIEFASKAQYATKAALSKASPAGNSPVVLPYKSKLPPPTAYAPAKPRLTTRTRFDTQSDSMDQDEYTLKLTMDLKRMEENKTKAARARAVPLPATAHNRPSAPPSKIREEPQLASKSEGAEKVAIAQEAKERKASQASPLLVKQATTQTVTTSTNTAVTVPQIDKGKDYALKDLPKGTQDNARTTQDVLTVPVAALQFVSSTRPIIRTSGDTRNVVAPTPAKSTSTKRSGRIATQDAEHLPSIGRAVTQSKQISALYKPRGPESLRLLIDSIATEIEYLVAGSPLPRLTLLRAQRQHQLKFPTLQEIERERAAYLEKTTRESRLQLLVDQETARSRHLLAEIGASSRAIQRETYYGWKDVMNAYIFAATDAYWLIRELASVYGAQCGTWLPHREKIDNLFCYDLAIAQQELRSLKQLQTRLTRTQHLFRVISEDLKALDKLAADKARYWETLNYEVEVTNEQNARAFHLSRQLTLQVRYRMYPHQGYPECWNYRNRALHLRLPFDYITISMMEVSHAATAYYATRVPAMSVESTIVYKRQKKALKRRIEELDRQVHGDVNAATQLEGGLLTRIGLTTLIEGPLVEQERFRVLRPILRFVLGWHYILPSGMRVKRAFAKRYILWRDYPKPIRTFVDAFRAMEAHTKDMKRLFDDIEEKIYRRLSGDHAEGRLQDRDSNLKIYLEEELRRERALGEFLDGGLRHSGRNRSRPRFYGLGDGLVRSPPADRIRQGEARRGKRSRSILLPKVASKRLIETARTECKHSSVIAPPRRADKAKSQPSTQIVFSFGAVNASEQGKVAGTAGPATHNIRRSGGISRQPVIKAKPGLQTSNSTSNERMDATSPRRRRGGHRTLLTLEEERRFGKQHERVESGHDDSHHTAAESKTQHPATNGPGVGPSDQSEPRARLTSFSPTPRTQNLHPAHMAHDYDILDGVPAPYGRGSSPIPLSEEAQKMKDSGTGEGESYNGSQEQGTAEELGQSSQEEHIPLTFQIPAQELKNAMQVSRSSGAAFWKHSLYRGPDGRKIKVHYCRNKEDSETVAQLFLNQDTLGFDLEWKPSYATKEKSKEKLLDSPVLTEKVIKEAVSLIQLASEDRIALFHIALHKGGTIDELVAPTLKKIMESPDISKAGVAVGGDATRLRTFLGIQCQGLFELSHLYRLVKFSEKAPRQVNKRLVSLAQQVGECLYLPLHKGDVRSSDWSKVLNWDQTVYAASDAYAGFRLFDVLEQRRKRLNPTPPRPAHLELNLPIRLAQALVDGVSDQTQIEEPTSEETQGGEVAYPTLPMEGLEEDSWTSSRESAENTQEVDVDAVAYPTLPVEGSEDDPLETDVEVEGTTASTTPGDSGLSEVSHAEDGGLASQIDIADTPHAANVSESKFPSTNAEVSIPKPIEVQHAEAWLENWQASLPTDYTPKASKAALRAYALWHHQSLTVPRIASILRAPPLQLTTVATYILEAVRIERLPFDGPRIREPLDVLPVSVHGRYRAVLNKAH